MTKGNKTGGKNYKKSKHGGTERPPYLEREEGQMFARVIRNMGNRNVQCYCNDGRTRLCHIRGGMRNRVWITVGDYVLITMRDLASVENKEKEKADLIAKFDPDHITRLKAEPGINERLFLQIEADAQAETGGFEFDAAEENEPDDEEVDINAI